ncbi:MAG TPA: helix-turn-helix domain-containing protein [Nocardioidaceae bacterium]|nr:helix-turn-helix domain-containing protein [Nocardioidaceae bacterium]
MPDHRRIDPTERAHLRDEAGYTPPIFRYAPGAGMEDLVRRYWVPVSSLPPGTSTVQRVLQYPVCLLVISDSYAIMVGPDTGLGRQELAGEGWAVGAMLQPAAGAMLLDGPVTDLTDDRVALDDVSTLDGAALADRVRAALEKAPAEPAAHRAAIDVLEAALDELGAVDEEGMLVNRIVEYVEERSEVQRVGQVCDRFDLAERTLQRLTARRIGLSPKWLIQRRRLHEAAERLRTGGRVDLAAVAAELGYADQAHFTRDFRTVTGLTPGGFAREPH